jgi:hypothetical protein
VDAIAPGQQEAFIAQERRQAQDPAPGLRALAGLDQVHVPVRHRFAVPPQAVVPERQAHVTVQPGDVGEVLLDHLTLVAEGDGELAQAVAGEALHDVPEQRPATHVDEGLGPALGLAAEARTDPPGEDGDFHALTPASSESSRRALRGPVWCRARGQRSRHA